MTAESFWEKLETLVSSYDIVIDRPAGLPHPDYPSMVYPVDYGYLEGTGAVDGGGVDIFVGATGLARVDGALLTVDLDKGDAEVKILYSCTASEMEDVHALLNAGSMGGLLVVRG